MFQVSIIFSHLKRGIAEKMSFVCIGCARPVLGFHEVSSHYAKRISTVSILKTLLSCRSTCLSYNLLL